MKTLTRYIPTGYTEYKPDLGDYPKDMFAVYVDLAKPAAIFYSGKQSKHTWYNRFNDIDEMKKKINTSISNIMSYADEKVKRAEARKTPSTFKVGDILDVSWGYDQTNVNFYQVIKTSGKRTVDIREIASKLVSGSGESYTTVVPVKDSFLVPGNEYDKTGLVMTKRVSDGGVRVYSFAKAHLWDGTPQYETGYGYGH